MSNDLAITRPLDEITAEHLDRVFADRVGPDRNLLCRIHALSVASAHLRPVLRGLAGEPDADETGDVIATAQRLEHYLKTGEDYSPA